MVGSADEGGVAYHVAGGDALQSAAPADLLLDEHVARHDPRRHPRAGGQDEGRAGGGQEHGRGQGNQAVKEGRKEGQRSKDKV